MLRKSDLTPVVSDIFSGKVCPYCNGSTKTLTQKEVYGHTYENKLMVCCVNYPSCNSYIVANEDGTALGRLAGPKLRKEKKRAKEVFNRLWICAYLKKEEAYQLLADHLNIDIELCNFDFFSLETIEKARKWSLEYIVEHSEKPKSYQKPREDFTPYVKENYTEDQINFIKSKLIEWYKETVFNQGDDYSAGITKNGQWFVSYSNDYPMQHGSGKTLTLSKLQFEEAMNFKVLPKRTVYFVEKSFVDVSEQYHWFKHREATDETFGQLLSQGREIVGAFPTEEIATIWVNFYNGDLNKEELTEILLKYDNNQKSKMV